MLANCGVLGLDWERVSLSSYVETMAAHNDAHEAATNGEKRPPSDWLREAMTNRVWG